MSTSQQTPVWIDCDTGHDDSFALLLLACDSKCRLLGVSATHGNAPVEKTAVNSKAVLQVIGRPDVPVYMGCAAPSKLPPCFAPDIHGESGLDGVTLLPEVKVETAQDHAEEAINRMCEAILAEPIGTVWLVAVGPLTNVAKALATKPELASHLRGLSIMGGSVGEGYTDAPPNIPVGEGPRIGNTTPFAEFNIYADPHAAAAVFSNPELSSKTTLITLDLSHNTRCVPEVRDKIFTPQDPNRSIVRRLYEEIVVFFAMTYKKFSIFDGPPLHDALASIAAVHPELLDDNGGERWDVSVVVSDQRWHKTSNPLDKVGQTTLTAAKPGTGVRVPRAVDLSRFWGMVDDCLRVAERPHLK